MRQVTIWDTDLGRGWPLAQAPLVPLLRERAWLARPDYPQPARLALVDAELARRGHGPNGEDIRAHG